MSGLRMKSFKELIEATEIDTAIRYYPHSCQYCKNPIQYFKPLIKHCNIAQNPSIKFFCSQSCRDRWILLSRNNFNPAQNKNKEMIKYG